MTLMSLSSAGSTVLSLYDTRQELYIYIFCQCSIMNAIVRIVYSSEPSLDNQLTSLLAPITRALLAAVSLNICVSAIDPFFPSGHSRRQKERLE